MARGDAGKKAAWSAYVKGRLDELEITVTELARRTGIPNKTIYNWTLGDGLASAETCLILAVAFKTSASEVLEACGYPILADAMAGKELRIAGTPHEHVAPSTDELEEVDEVISLIMARRDLTEAERAKEVVRYRERLAALRADTVDIVNTVIEARKNARGQARSA